MDHGGLAEASGNGEMGARFKTHQRHNTLFCSTSRHGATSHTQVEVLFAGFRGTRDVIIGCSLWHMNVRNCRIVDLYIKDYKGVNN